MKNYLITTLVGFGFSLSGKACFINQPMIDEIKMFETTATSIKYAATDPWIQTMDFYVTFNSPQTNKAYVGMIKFNQFNCSVVESKFKELLDL